MTIEDIQGLIVSEAEQYDINPNELRDQSLKIELEHPEITEGLIDDINDNIIFDKKNCIIHLIINLY